MPEAGLLLIIGIDQFLDMGRSATNVVGNSLATAVVAKWEGEDVTRRAAPDPTLRRSRREACMSTATARLAAMAARSRSWPRSPSARRRRRQEAAKSGRSPAR